MYIILDWCFLKCKGSPPPSSDQTVECSCIPGEGWSPCILRCLHRWEGWGCKRSSAGWTMRSADHWPELCTTQSVLWQRRPAIKELENIGVWYLPRTQHDPQAPWFLTSVTTPWSLQSQLSGTSVFTLSSLTPDAESPGTILLYPVRNMFSHSSWVRSLHMLIPRV